MTGNPYTPPRAPVADPVYAPLERPKEVTLAVRSILLSFVISLIGKVAIAVESGTSPIKDWGDASFAAVTLLIALVDVWKISEGRNWARVLYVIFTAMTVIGTLMFFREIALGYKGRPLMAVAALAQLGLQLFAIFLLFTAQAQHWFRQGGRSLLVPHSNG